MRASRPFAPGYGIAPAEGGEGLLPWSWAEERLLASRSFWLSTVAGGQPHTMPVWGVWSGGAFFFSTGEQSRKARNLAANPHCTVVTEHADEAVILEGVATMAPAGDELRDACAAYAAKYPGFALDAPIGRVFIVRPQKVFAFIDDADRFGATATRWTFA